MLRAGETCVLLAAAIALVGCDDAGVPIPGGGAEPEAADASVIDCAPGELVLVDGSCQAAGLPPGWSEPGPVGGVVAGVPAGQCGEGFEADGQGGCEAVLPATPCGSGAMALPGETRCREIAPCGSGAWGDIPVDAATQFVDGTFVGVSDGSAPSPWTTIQAGVDAAAEGAVVAVAAGSYTGSVAIDKPVRLWGVCPAMVHVIGTTGEASIVIQEAPGTEVHAMSVAGPISGVNVHASPGVLLDRLWIHDTGALGAGLVDTPAPGIAFEASLVERAVGFAVFVRAAEVTLDGLAVRDTSAFSNGGSGHGVEVQRDPTSGVGSAVTIRGSHLERNRDVSIQASGSDLAVETTVVRDTTPEASDGLRGWGVCFTDDLSEPAKGSVRQSVIQRSFGGAVLAFSSEVAVELVTAEDIDVAAAQTGVGSGFLAEATQVARAHLTLRDSVARRTTGAAIWVDASDGSIERVLVQDTGADPMFGKGFGVLATSFLSATERAKVAVTSSIVERTQGVGVEVQGADLTVQGSIVRQTLPDPGPDQLGVGIVALYDTPAGRAALELRTSLVEESHGGGVFVNGTDAVIDATLVRDTRPRPIDDTGGVGVLIGEPFGTPVASVVEIRGSAVEQSHGYGLGVFGSNLVMESSAVRDVLPQPSDGNGGEGLFIARFDDQGASAALRECLVERVQHAGVVADGAELTLDGTRLADVVPQESDERGGVGVAAIGQSDARSKLTMRSAVVERARMGGVLVDRADAIVERSLIRDVAAQASDAHFGRGIVAQNQSTLSATRSVVEACHEIGIHVQKSDATIVDTLVSGTLEREADGFLGDGITIDGDGSGPTTVERCRIEKSARAGLASFGAAVVLDGTVFECNPIDLDGESFEGPPALENVGGNVCGCEGEVIACVLQSAGLEPPSPLPAP